MLTVIALPRLCPLHAKVCDHVGISCVLTLARLMDNAIRKAKESGEKKLQAKDIRKVTEVSVAYVRCEDVLMRVDDAESV